MDFTIALAILVVAVTALLYILKSLNKNLNYWEGQGIPAVKSYPIIGSDFDMLIKPMNEIYMERLKKYGRIYGSHILSAKVINISDPKMIKMILVKDFHNFVNRTTKKTGIKMLDSGFTSTNENWKRIRSVVSPTFSSGKIKKMFFIIETISKRLTESILEFADKGQSVDLKGEFSKFSVEALVTCTFGLRFDSFKNPNHPIFLNIKKAFHSRVSFLGICALKIMPTSIIPVRDFMLRWIGLSYFENTAKEIIENRRNQSKQAQENVDFLQLMLDAKDGDQNKSEAVQEETEDINEIINGKKTRVPSPKTLDEDEIIAQCTVFLFAGHDGIATTLARVAHSLACHMEIQEKLLKEVDECWEKNGGIDYESVNNMTYLHAVISETLRLQSALPAIRRVASENYTIPDTNIVIPKDTYVTIPLYAVHHDPEFFPDPEKFDPDRFLPENKDKIVPYSFLPFGDGPRNCIAIRFSFMEIKFCLAYLLHHVKFCPTEETLKPLQIYNGGATLQCKNVIVRPERRRTSEKN